MAPSPHWDDITRRQEFMVMKFKELQVVALQAGVSRRKVNLAFDKKELIQLILAEPDQNRSNRRIGPVNLGFSSASK